MLHSSITACILILSVSVITPMSRGYRDGGASDRSARVRDAQVLVDALTQIRQQATPAPSQPKIQQADGTAKKNLGAATVVSLATLVFKLGLHKKLAALAKEAAGTVFETKPIVPPVMTPPIIQQQTSASVKSRASTTSTAGSDSKSILQELWGESTVNRCIITGSSFVGTYLGVKAFKKIRDRLSPLARAQLDTLRISHENAKARLERTENEKAEELAHYKKVAHMQAAGITEATSTAINAYFDYCNKNNFDINAPTLPQEGARLYRTMTIYIALMRSQEAAA